MSAKRAQAARLNVLVVLAAALWGLYWLPVRELAAPLPGAWGSVLILAVTVVVLLPFGLRHARTLARGDLGALAAILLGGASFAMYSVALVEGRVAVVILLFFLTPVWSTVIGRWLLGWPTARLRYAAIAVGLVGLVLVLGADGGLPAPRSEADWLGLLSGMLWSVATTGIRLRRPLPAGAATFVFALGGLATALALAFVLGGPPPAALPATATALTWLLLAAVVWWGLSLAVLLWAATRLEPARLGILQMSEVVTGVVSAALLAGEAMGPQEAIGGALIVVAAVLEVWPVRAKVAAPRSLGPP